jgi:hypothetical protein
MRAERGERLAKSTKASEWSLEKLLDKLILSAVGDDRPKPKPEGTGPAQSPPGYGIYRPPRTPEPKKPGFLGN